eukprot:TRINITY_DN4027_c0_g1_i1.p1 TRINITY_DN4027_c0_g1~~TRINITY_DN4027_c0_g1_i1.p1  ORF type:complete len:249 (+),score=21.81 TRINITY_DN4027_c0_g1_i1:32-748(+)
MQYHHRGGVVCKHWLKGLCKNTDDCEFLHQYVQSRMPECYFFAQYSDCTNHECPFLHIKPEKFEMPCPNYQRGFCELGPNCKFIHEQTKLCPDYLAGFCANGPNCHLAHPKHSEKVDLEQIKSSKPKRVVCYHCNEEGHKAPECPKASWNRKKIMQKEQVDRVKMTDVNDLIRSGPQSTMTPQQQLITLAALKQQQEQRMQLLKSFSVGTPMVPAPNLSMPPPNMAQPPLATTSRHRL